MTAKVGKCSRPKIWVDLDNSPHVPFFVPIIEELQGHGYAIFLTARDCFQVSDLIKLHGLDCPVIGRHYGKNRIAKLAGLSYRAMQLAPGVLRAKPDLALSHGSRAQLILSKLIRIPTLMIDDYEFSTQLPFALPRWLMLPDAIPTEQAPINKRRILRYQGIKEDVYVPKFHADSSIVKTLGFSDAELVVTVRPPAEEAHYHTNESDQLFQAVLELLAAKERVKVVFLPRSPKQASSLRKKWPNSTKFIIPQHALDGLNLIWHSDLVISGGGTMNREAAALGIPVYSTFRGKIGAVDRYLAAANRLVLLESVADVATKINLCPRTRTAQPQTANTRVLQQVVSNIIKVTEMERTHDCSPLAQGESLSDVG